MAGLTLILTRLSLITIVWVAFSGASLFGQEPVRAPADSAPTDMTEADSVQAAAPVLATEEDEGVKPWLLELDGLFGVSLVHYNRVDGLAPGWGLKLDPTEPSKRPQIGGQISFATTYTQAYWHVFLEQELPGPGASRIGGAWFNRSTTFDTWKFPSRENDLWAFLVGTDNLDWWREQGLLAYFDTETLDGRFGIRASYLYADQTSLPNRNPFVLFGSNTFRDNPAVAEGNLSGLQLDVRIDTRDVQSPLLPAPGWRFDVEWETSLGGDIDFSRTAFDLRRFTRFGTDYWWDWRAVWMGPIGTKDLPEQRKMKLGGPGSLRGFSPASFVGDAGLQANTEVRVPLPVSQKLAILFLSWHLVGFADVGTVEGSGWHADVGGGVSGINILSYLGFFVAQRVTDLDVEDDGPRFIVRLNRDF